MKEENIYKKKQREHQERNSEIEPNEAAFVREYEKDAKRTIEEKN